jgi:hypothetical protein
MQKLINDFVNIVKKYDKKKSDERQASHSFMTGAFRRNIGLSGSLIIDNDDDLKEFYAVYANTIKHLQAPKPINLISISERRSDKDNHILMFDIDMKVKIVNGDVDDLIPESFIGIFDDVRDCVSKLFVNDIDRTCVVTGCYSYDDVNVRSIKKWYTKLDDNLYKVGFHIYFPGIFVDYHTNVYIRKMLIDKYLLNTSPNGTIETNDITIELAEEGKWFLAVDEQIANDVKCRLVGCCKATYKKVNGKTQKINEQRVYEVVAYYDHDNHQLNIRRVDTINSDLPSLLYMVSLRRTGELTPISDGINLNEYDDDERFGKSHIVNGKKRKYVYDGIDDTDIKNTLWSITRRVVFEDDLTIMSTCACKNKTIPKDDDDNGYKEPDTKKCKKPQGYMVKLANMHCLNKGGYHNGATGGYVYITREFARCHCYCKHDNKTTDSRLFGLCCPDFSVKTRLHLSETQVLFGDDLPKIRHNQTSSAQLYFNQRQICI